jgi:phosphoserine phosphatase
MKTAFCFDFDGTVTTREILPEIGKAFGNFGELEYLTLKTIRGEIPFEDSFRLRVDMLKNISISEVRDIVASVEVYPAIAQFIEEFQSDTFIVTGNLDVWVADRVKTFGCNLISSEAIFEKNQLFGVNKVINKAEEIKKLRVVYDRIIAVGDGVSDAEMLAEADFGIAFGGTHDPVDSVIKAANFVVYDSGALCSLLRTL